MNKTIFIGIGILLLLVVGGGYVMSQQESKTMMKESAKEERDTMSTEKIDSKMNDQDTMKQDEKNARYTGTILAGKTSPYIAFNTADYDMAKKEGKTLFLEFYASWCPICRAQAPKLVEGFNALDRDDIVGFRVNYNDPDTDEAEKTLAKEFGVTYQHTHVIVKNGKVLSKSNDDLDIDSFTALISGK